MKKSKILVPALAMLVMSTAATVSGTVAWFTANNTVTAKGMVVKAKAEGSLVISEAVPSKTTATVTHNFADTTATELSASTYDWTVGTTTGLKYITNSDVISPETGLQFNEDEDPTYADAKNSTTPTKVDFYKDYKVFISSGGLELTNQKIKVELTNAKLTDVNAAVSIAFYCDATASNTAVTPTSTNKVGILNLAQLDAEANNGTSKKDFYIGESGITIPQNSSNTGISILMRVYYDGYLKNHVGDGEHVVENKLTDRVANGTTVYDNKGTAISFSDDVKSIEGLYSTLTDDPDTTFAKNIDMADITNQSLSVKFTAETIAA